MSGHPSCTMTGLPYTNVHFCTYPFGVLIYHHIQCPRFSPDSLLALPVLMFSWARRTTRTSQNPIPTQHRTTCVIRERVVGRVRYTPQQYVRRRHSAQCTGITLVPLTDLTGCDRCVNYFQRRGYNWPPTINPIPIQELFSHNVPGIPCSRHSHPLTSLSGAWCDLTILQPGCGRINRFTASCRLRG